MTKIGMNSLSMWLVLATTGVWASTCWAEAPCPPGERMVAQQNVPGASFPICQSIPSNDTRTSQPRVVWADRWGAIVSDEAEGQIGVSSRHSSRSEAIEAAILDCSNLGGKNCKLDFAYRNQCTAIAAGLAALSRGGGARWNISGDPEQEAAEKRAIKRCGDLSGTICQLLYSACSYAERVQ